MEDRTEGPGQEAGLIEARLRSVFARHRLSPAQRRVSEYMVSHPHETLYLSSIDLSSKVGVSQPSVTRLATSMGFRGYAELQERLRSLVLKSNRLRPGEALNKLQAAIRIERHNLTALEESLSSLDHIGKVGRLLASSEPLAVLGVRAASFLAAYFSYFAAKIHREVRLLDGGGTLLLDQLLQVRTSGGSWLLLFLVPRYPREVLPILEGARQLGFKVALITDHPPISVTDLCDEVLSAPVGHRLAFDSYSAPTVLTCTLLEALADAEPFSAQERLEEHERLASDRQFFLDP